MATNTKLADDLNSVFTGDEAEILVKYLSPKPGPAGVRGSRVYTGTGDVPATSITSRAITGDYYLDALSGNVSIFDDAGNWTYTSNLRGPQGLVGSAGAQGVPGSAGARGSDGSVGAQGIQGVPGAKGDTGATGGAGAAGASGAQGPAGFSTVTPSTPTRTMGTAFQPHATKACWVQYSISISCALSLSAGAEGKVELFCDSNTTPTALRGTISNANTGVLTVGINLTQKLTQNISYLVPAGHYVKLVSTNVTGTPTFLMISQVESVLG